MKMENGSKTDTTGQVKEEKPAEETAEVKPEDSKVGEAKVKTETKVEEAKVKTETKVEEAEKTEETKDEKMSTDEVKAEVKVEENKADVKSEEPSEDVLEKIKSQVEFYFGDINLQRDKFLIEQTKLDEGWIPMTVMLNFQLLASMSKDPEVIIKSLANSKLMQVSDDRKKIRRSPECPLPVFDEAYRKAQAERTVYIKGFPLTDIYIQKLKEFFKDYEPFENIIMRKYLDKEKKLQFKGSIFIQFKTLDDAKAFMARESVKYGDTELIRKWSEEYSVEKAKEKEEKKLKKGEKKEKKTDDNGEEAEADEESDKLELPKGSIVHFTGTQTGTTREMIKECVMGLGGEVAYVDFAMGQSEGWIRLQDENSGKAVVEKMTDNKMTVDKGEVTFRVLEGEEEEKYLATVKETIKNLRSRNKNAKRGGRSRRGRSGGQRGRKRHGSSGHGAVASKKTAAE